MKAANSSEHVTQIAVDALALAHQLADVVGERLVGHFGGVREAKVKGDGTLVTQADLEADRHITDAVRAQYPSHDIVSEELDTVYEGAPWCWVIDPLDGTTNFAQGVPIWCVSIALAYEGWPVMGLVDVPTLGTRYHCIEGGGAFENGEPVAVRPPVDVTDSQALQNELFTVCSRTFLRFTVDLPMKPRIIGSAAYNFCLMAAGVSVASMDVSPKAWDMAAGWLLVREAGGAVTQLSGNPMFPLVAGRDYDSKAHPQLSAPSAAVAQDLAQRIKRR